MKKHNQQTKLFRQIIRAILTSGKSPKALADAAGVSSQTIKNWTSGRVATPQLAKAEKVITALGKSFLLS